MTVRFVGRLPRPNIKYSVVWRERKVVVAVFETWPVPATSVNGTMELPILVCTAHTNPIVVAPRGSSDVQSETQGGSLTKRGQHGGGLGSDLQQPPPLCPSHRINSSTLSCFSICTAQEGPSVRPFVLVITSPHLHRADS